MYRWILIVLTNIFILSACSVDPQPPNAPIVNGWKQNEAESGNYRVQPDDSIYSIAWSFGMDYRDLARYNNLSEPYQLHAGQLLRMSPASAAASQTAPAAVVVQPQPAIGVTFGSGSSSGTQTNASVQNQNKNQQTPGIPLASETRKHQSAQSTQTVHTTSVATATVATPWVWPTKGSVVKGYSVAGNRGIDIRGQMGQPVVAASSGKVVYAGSGLKGYGKLIIVKHNDDDLSAYAFNRGLSVKEGDSVKVGQKIASMGKNDDGQPMLHFEIRRNGKPVNPMPYLGG